MRISKRQLQRIIREEKRKLVKESMYGKLGDDATGSGMNLDQEVYFGLEQEILALVEKFANNPRYARYGVTHDDVVEVLKDLCSNM